MLKFSVLIAHYNNDVFIKDCIESILAQTYTNWEAIILDDGSSKESKEKVKELIKDDDRFFFYENDKNQGVGFTKAKLIELATGEICGFVDPDDAILPNAIKDAVTEFQKDDEVVLVYSRYMNCDANLNPKSEVRFAKQVINKDPFFFNLPIRIAHFVSFRRSAYLSTTKINTDLRISEDQDLYLKLYEKGKVKFVNSTNYLYRNHSAGTSQNENKENSHQYFGQVIFDAMNRRGIKQINGKKIPNTYKNYREIYNLLAYQNSLWYRLKNRILLLFEK